MSRVIDIVLRNGEVITVGLADLDPDPASILELLKEGECGLKAWLQVAVEHWRLGQLAAAEKIAKAAVERAKSDPDGEYASVTLPRIHALIANVALERSRTAPKYIFPGAKSDVWPDLFVKTDYYAAAAQSMNHPDEGDGLNDLRTRIALYLTRGNFLISTREIEDALNVFEQVLNIRGSNIPALIGMARICYVRKQYREALKLFQRALVLKPDSKPDPRIGIGLCLWALGNREKARVAWQRSAELYPEEWPSQLLLGLDAVNSSKDPACLPQDTAALYRKGLALLQRVFKLNTSNASSANALSDFFLRRGDNPKALKLAERAIQFADTVSLLADGHVRAARVAHADGQFDDARHHYVAAMDNAPRNLLAILGVAQMQVQNDEILAAIHTLDVVVSQSENDACCLECLIMLASLRAYARPALSTSDSITEKSRAKELFERVTTVLNISHKAGYQDQAKPAPRVPTSVQVLRDDVEMHLEIASLWHRENIGRASSALQEAIKVNSLGPLAISSSKLQCNFAVLQHLSGAYAEARALYEEALLAALSEGTTESEMSSVTMLYNLARVYEDTSEYNLARDAYMKLLSRHPEYVDAKARLAFMRMEEKRGDEAHGLVKQVLYTGEKNSEIRAFYIWLLCQTGQIKPAKAFTFNVLKDDGHDVYALCAAGRLSFNEARESRDPSPGAASARKENFLKAANIYAKALTIDPSCAMAAQGLAILIAEDSLGTWAPGQTADDAQMKNKSTRNAREALDILAKVRETFQDGSVYINMGHCHFARDEHDKAIENYETASVRFYDGQNVPVLLYVARAWFAKANKIGSFTAMRQALKHSQMALHTQPSDKAVLYNIAMIEQKAAELLFSLPPERRKLADLRLGIGHAAHAQKLFASLASDTMRPLPYSQDIAQNRYRYGESMLRRSAEHIAAQELYEAQTKARMDVARRQRQEERERLDEEQHKRTLEVQRKADDLAKRRKELREKAEEWATARKAESDEEEKRAEKSRKAATRKPRQEANLSGDENGDGKKDRKKRRPRTVRRRRDDEPLPAGYGSVGAEEDAYLSTEETRDPGPADDAPERSKRVRVKRRFIDDQEDGPSSTVPAVKRKKIKSKEIIDSEDDM